MTEQEDFYITTTVGDVFDIPKAGVVLTMSLEPSVWKQRPEEWQPSHAIHAGVSYRIEAWEKVHVFKVNPEHPMTIGVCIGRGTPRSHSSTATWSSCGSHESARREISRQRQIRPG